MRWLGLTDTRDIGAQIYSEKELVWANTQPPLQSVYALPSEQRAVWKACSWSPSGLALTAYVLAFIHATADTVCCRQTVNVDSSMPCVCTVRPAPLSTICAGVTSAH